MVITSHVCLIQYAIDMKLNSAFRACRIFAKLVAQILQEVCIVIGAANGRGN